MLAVPPYVTDQLIPYLGNKRKLIPLIAEAVALTGLTGGVFYDAFAGSTVVSRLAKTLGFRVISNDWEPYSSVISHTYVALNRAPEFAALGGLEAAIEHMNGLASLRGYIARHYCPKDDEDYDPDRERMFYTQENGRRIDAMREAIASWREDGAIDLDEERVLLSALIFQCAYCSNTSGVFKGFHRGWGGATKTAWYRIRSRLTLAPPLFWDNGEENTVLRDDANSLLDRVECDIAYLDPPYNQHQYGSNYHLLNTVALWDKPDVGERFESRCSARGKAAIRDDWQRERRSRYCYRSTALEAFGELVQGLRTRYILVSYSTDGVMELGDVLSVLASRGAISAVTQRYRRYRVSSQRPSARSHNREFVIVVDTGRRCGRAEMEKVRRLVYAEHGNKE